MPCAIGTGATDFNAVRTKVDADAAKVVKYIGTLVGLGFVRKEFPCGKGERGRNALYGASDDFLAFSPKAECRHCASQ